MYQKHQLYLDDYPIKDKVVNLPDKCNWIVKGHIGSGDFTDEDDEQGDICLILNETCSEVRGFWPVMSFLTKDEAVKLSQKLARACKKRHWWDWLRI